VDVFVRFFARHTVFLFCFLTPKPLCQLVKLMGLLAPFQGLQFTGMGGPMGTEDEYDT
jgi:hypothetical protein